jgi:hypothetical protein
MPECIPAPFARQNFPWIVGLIVLGCGLVLYATAPRGPALSGDSAVYVSVADALATGRGFRQFDDVPYTRWAPLLPLLLAPWSALGIDPARASQGLNLLALATTLGLAASWLARRVVSVAIRGFALAFLLASATLIETAVFVWSDLPFLALMLGALVAWDALDDVAASAQRRRVALVAGACTAAACLMRYAGLALVPVGVAMILVFPAPTVPAERAGRVKRREDAARFAALALAPIALWVAHNFAVGAGPFGPRAASGIGPLAQSRDLLAALGVWAVGSGRGTSFRAWAGLGLTAALTLPLIAARRSGNTRPPASVVAMVGFVAASAALLVGWSSYASIERLNERYTIPLVVPGVLVAAWAADQTVARSGRAFRRRLVLAVIATALGLWIGVAAVRTARHVERYRGAGTWGYNTARWDRSLATGLLHAVAGLPADARIYSDAPDAIYARLKRPARLLPRLVPNAAGPPTLPAEWERDCPLFWVVEFRDERGARRDASARLAVCDGCGFRSLVEYEDGILVRVEACPPTN